MKLQYKLKAMLGAAALTLATFAGLPAYAGTLAGTTITSNATLDYSVGGNTQPTIDTATTSGSSGVSFVVDRKVDVTVTAGDSTAVTVTPGQTTFTTATKFTITNLSNAVLDFALTAANGTTGATVTLNTTPYTDNADATSFTIYADVGTAGTFDAADISNGAITSINDLAKDNGTAVVWVVANTPNTVVNNNEILVALTATALESDGSVLKRSNGDAINLANSYVDDTGVNKNADNTSLNTQLTLVIDEAGATDGAKHGDHSAYSAFKVASAALNVNKYVSVVWDPVNNSTSPKAIPGAVLKYCVVISNVTGSQDATSVGLTDDLPTTLLYISSHASAGGVAAVSGATGLGAAPTTVAGCTGGTAISSGLSEAPQGGTGGRITTTGLTVTQATAAYIVFYAELQ